MRTLAPGDQVQFGDSLYTLHGDSPPLPAADLPMAPYVPPAPPAPSPLSPPTQRLPLDAFPAAAAPAPYPTPPLPRRARLSVPALALGGCAGLLTLALCGVGGFLVSPFGRQWLAGLFGGG
jgi:hypothetical protein